MTKRNCTACGYSFSVPDWLNTRITCPKCAATVTSSSTSKPTVPQSHVSAPSGPTVGTPRQQHGAATARGSTASPARGGVASSAGSARSSTEQELWEASPSLISHIWTFAICIALSCLIVPAFLGIWKFLQLKCTRYQLTTQRLCISEGVFNRQHSDVELYRVKDVSVKQPWYTRPFRIANINLITSDRLEKDIVLLGIRDAVRVHEVIREHVELTRDLKRVAEIDLG